MTQNHTEPGREGGREGGVPCGEDDLVSRHLSLARPTTTKGGREGGREEGREGRTVQ